MPLRGHFAVVRTGSRNIIEKSEFVDEILKTKMVTVILPNDVKQRSVKDLKSIMKSLNIG